MEVLNEKVDLSGSLTDLKDRLDYLVNNNTRLYFDKDRYDRYRKYASVDNVYIYTYPNIYLDVRFKVSSPALLNYVIEKIKASAKNNTPFDPEKTRNESMGVMFNALTGINKGPMSRKEFRDRFQQQVLGSFSKIQMRARCDKILELMYNMPNSINYVTQYLLGTHATAVYTLVYKLSNDLDLIERYNPDVTQTSIYKSSLHSAVEDLMYVYKAVKMVMMELNDEYYRIMENVSKQVGN